MSLARRRLMTANEPDEPDVLYLYKEGDECTDVTGGWKELWSFGAAGSTRIIEKNSNELYVQATTNTNGGNVGIIINNPIDLTKYTHYIIKVTRLKDRSNYTPYDVGGYLDVFQKIPNTDKYYVVDKSGARYKNAVYTGVFINKPYSDTKYYDYPYPEIYNYSEYQYGEIPQNAKYSNGHIALWASPVSGGIGISRFGLLTEE